jgi:hypothetical protein
VIRVRRRACSNLRLRVPRAHPIDEFGGGFHRRQATLPDQCPVVEQVAAFNLGQSRRWFKVSKIRHIYDDGFVVFGIRARFRLDFRQSDNSRLPARMVNEYPIAGSHALDRLQRLRISDSVPSCSLVLTKLVDRVSERLSFREKVSHVRLDCYCTAAMRHRQLVNIATPVGCARIITVPVCDTIKGSELSLTRGKSYPDTQESRCAL